MEIISEQLHPDMSSFERNEGFQSFLTNLKKIGFFTEWRECLSERLGNNPDPDKYLIGLINSYKNPTDLELINNPPLQQGYEMLGSTFFTGLKPYQDIKSDRIEVRQQIKKIVAAWTILAILKQMGEGTRVQDGITYSEMLEKIARRGNINGPIDEKKIFQEKLLNAFKVAYTKDPQAIAELFKLMYEAEYPSQYHWASSGRIPLVVAEESNGKITSNVSLNEIVFKVFGDDLINLMQENPLGALALIHLILNVSKDYISTNAYKFNNGSYNTYLECLQKNDLEACKNLFKGTQEAKILKPDNRTLVILKGILHEAWVMYQARPIV